MVNASFDPNIEITFVVTIFIPFYCKHSKPRPCPKIQILWLFTMKHARTSCNHCEQHQEQETNSPLHAYFSSLMSQRSIAETTLIQDNPSTSMSRRDRRSTMSKTRKVRRCECNRSSMDRSASSSDVAINDELFLLEDSADRWRSEPMESSSEHSADASGRGRDRVRLSVDKPKLPKRRSSPGILDQTNLQSILCSFGDLDFYD